jgi:hypothetical protein
VKEILALIYVFSICMCVSGQTQPAATLSIVPTKVEFGKQAVGSQATSVTVTLANPTAAPIAIQEILASGIDFPSRNNCGKQLAAGAQCTVEISFKPLTTGDRAGILQITASDSPGSHFVPLTGTGVQ